MAPVQGTKASSRVVGYLGTGPNGLLGTTRVGRVLGLRRTAFGQKRAIGSKFRCIRSTPTEMQSMSENDLECFASAGVNSPESLHAMCPKADAARRVAQSHFRRWPVHGEMGVQSLPLAKSQMGT